MGVVTLYRKITSVLNLNLKLTLCPTLYLTFCKSAVTLYLFPKQKVFDFQSITSIVTLYLNLNTAVIVLGCPISMGFIKKKVEIISAVTLYPFFLV